MPCFGHLQPDAALAQFGAEGHQVQHRAGQPVQPRDDQHIALAQDLQHQVQLRPGGLRTGGGVDVDVALGAPGAASASAWWSGFCSAVETRPYPISMR